MSTEHTIDGRLVDVKRALPRDKAPGPTRYIYSIFSLLLLMYQSDLRPAKSSLEVWRLKSLRKSSVTTSASLASLRMPW